MPRPSAVWVNTASLSRALDHARQGGADPLELLGAERALAAGEGRAARRFAMIFAEGFQEAHDLIWRHARHRLYTMRVFDYLLSLAGRDPHGIAMVEPRDIAERLDIPYSAVPSCLVDLEAEPIAVLTRIRKRRQVRGIELTGKVFRKPVPGRKRNGAEAARAVQ